MSILNNKDSKFLINFFTWVLIAGLIVIVLMMLYFSMCYILSDKIQNIEEAKKEFRENVTFYQKLADQFKQVDGSVNP